MGDYYFFAADQETESARIRREGAAREICATCVVLVPCRRYALDTEQIHGVWGGLSELDLSKRAGGANANAHPKHVVA
ncbi:hypothetical protein M2280_005421 [Prescottella agglutinans]|uniref:4Fe-4S Wbl-type domain-containing protein n=2 Tax=Prescottella agglutinans TaxID=1644129 RepID=A0ABT6MLD3_9NOCA|nr:hypothetical protein [Prescottella agglutinans]